MAKMVLSKEIEAAGDSLRVTTREAYIPSAEYKLGTSYYLNTRYSEPDGSVNVTVPSDSYQVEMVHDLDRHEDVVKVVYFDRDGKKVVVSAVMVNNELNEEYRTLMKFVYELEKKKDEKD